MLIVLTTVANISEAESLAGKLVTAKLAACVQVLPPMTSIYMWQGKMHRDHEHLLLIKTLNEKYDDLRECIVANHSYSVPEIVAIESCKVSGRYLGWMKELLG